MECPIRNLAFYTSRFETNPQTECGEDSCAWWVSGANSCAISVIAVTGEGLWVMAKQVASNEERR